MEIPVIDLFAGPGGLGEGFASLREGRAFKIIVSAEMESSARETLRLRAFFRLLKRQGAGALKPYHDFCNGLSESPWDMQSEDAWDDASREARQIILGSEDGNRELNGILDRAHLGPERPWILIGGPPCQAYSLVGRARNRGKVGYRAEDDHRHFLYREYLRIIQRHKPTVFVMENVKGILSSRVDGKKIIHTILADLADPEKAIGLPTTRGYRIYSLVTGTYYERGMNAEAIDASDFVVRSEQFGVPQARHRVILVGVREDVNFVPGTLRPQSKNAVQMAIGDLPRLRSRLSKDTDGAEQWALAVKGHLGELAHAAGKRPDLVRLAVFLGQLEKRVGTRMNPGALRVTRGIGASAVGHALTRWYRDDKLRVWLNHESRGHMTSDLRRYIFASAYAKTYGASPKGHEEFDLPGLRPEHENWESGKFADRFRVQLGNQPATTITSHISKDGHYFIHPDPTQCRSLTVREAARLQTFPDNYFFQGNRTQQFAQVGNAVPPYLAMQIAKLVAKIPS